MVMNPIVGVYIPIIRIPIKGGMTIPNIAAFDHGTYSYISLCHGIISHVRKWDAAYFLFRVFCCCWFNVCSSSFFWKKPSFLVSFPVTSEDLIMESPIATVRGPNYTPAIEVSTAPKNHGHWWDLSVCNVLVIHMMIQLLNITSHFLVIQHRQVLRSTISGTMIFFPLENQGGISSQICVYQRVCFCCFVAP